MLCMDYESEIKIYYYYYYYITWHCDYNIDLSFQNTASFHRTKRAVAMTLLRPLAHTACRWL